jgi:hypothetical protein
MFAENIFLRKTFTIGLPQSQRHTCLLLLKNVETLVTKISPGLPDGLFT